jgi:DpnII restriction endonuclease
VKREKQTLEKLVDSLSSIESQWMDALAERVISTLERFPTKPNYDREDLTDLLEADFEVGLTIIRLFLDRSKDEFTQSLRHAAPHGTGVVAFRRHRAELLTALCSLGALEALRDTVHRPVRWSDVLVERLKSGRGSAIKGQRRGKLLEDFTGRIVSLVFGEGSYDLRCQFVGETGQSSEKADFAIPSKSDARILIEVKAYGATGSKQTDVLGDVERIVAQKRHDTNLLLVTDGITWRDRKNDLRKLISLQNRGRITRIYTLKMAEDLGRDLRQMKAEYGL